MTVKQFENVSNESLCRQRALRATNSLMQQLEIAEGDCLSFVLEQPQATDNREAICQWLLTKQNGKLLNLESYSMLASKLKVTLLDASSGWR